MFLVSAVGMIWGCYIGLESLVLRIWHLGSRGLGFFLEKPR